MTGFIRTTPTFRHAANCLTDTSLGTILGTIWAGLPVLPLKGHKEAIMRDAMGNEVTGWDLALAFVLGLAEAAVIMAAWAGLYWLLPDGAKDWIFVQVTSLLDWLDSFAS